MKQSAAKTLGVAALGAAFAAAGAGAASALPGVPNAGGLLGSLPTQAVTKAVPAPGAESLTSGQNALAGAAKPAAGLLGGLPLPTSGLPLPGLGG